MTDTTSTVNALEAALEAAADGDMVGSLLDPRDLAAFVVKTLIALGAVMPDGAAKLRAEAEEQRNLLMLRAAALSTAWAEREALREQVADALALCDEIRPDSVLGTSVEVRLGLVRDRLAMTNPKSAPTGGDSDGR